MNVAIAGKDGEVIKLWEKDAVISKGRGAGETGNMSGFLEYEGEKWEWRAGTDSSDEARRRDGGRGEERERGEKRSRLKMVDRRRSSRSG